MDTNEMKSTAVRFVEEFWNSGNVDALQELMTTDVVVHSPDVGGIEGLKAFANKLRSAFPDWHSTPEELIAEGDTVVERWTGRGTHSGSLFGEQPTGKQVSVPGTVYYHFRDGKISEFRGTFDQFSLMAQIGAARTV
jgi:steroid delta-isomerase-like uncharacterized protein